MIRLSFNIELPSSWYKCPDVYKTDVSKHGQITEHKFWEFQFANAGWGRLLTVDLDLSAERDHAGLQVLLMLFGWFVEFNIYDHRHWKYDEHRWYRSDEDPLGEK